MRGTVLRLGTSRSGGGLGIARGGEADAGFGAGVFCVCVRRRVGHEGRGARRLGNLFPPSIGKQDGRSALMRARLSLALD